MNSRIKSIFYSIAFLWLNLIFIGPIQAKESTQELDYLLEQLFYWQGQNNDFNQEVLLQKISKVDAEHPVYLEALLMASVKEKDFLSAQQYLYKLKQKLQGNEYYLSLNQYVTTFQYHREKLSQARISAKRRRYADALKYYDDIFAQSTPHYLLALEYWLVMVEVKPKQRGYVKNKLYQLTKQYPSNQKIKITYLEQLVRSGTYTIDVYNELNELVNNSVWHVEAKRAWQYGLEHTEVSNNNHHLFERYLLHFPEDNFVKLHYEQGKIRLVRHKKMLSIPQYLAKLEAYKLLDNDGSLRLVENKINYALTYFTKDAELIAALGKVRLRQGKPAQAMALFKQSIKLDKPRRVQWQELYQTAKYWHNITLIKEHIAANRLTQAHQLIQPLYRLSHEGNMHKILDADIHSLRNERSKAEALYQSVLKHEPHNGSALRGLLALKELYDGVESTQVWINQLSLVQKKQIKESLLSFDIAYLRTLADKQISLDQPNKAIVYLGQALKLNPKNPWIRYDLASIYLKQGNISGFDYLYQKLPTSNEGKYAYALLQASQERYPSAINLLNSIPKAQRTTVMTNALQRFTFERLLLVLVAEKSKSQQLTQLTDFESTIEYNTELRPRLAQIYQQYHFYPQAINLYKQLSIDDRQFITDYQIALSEIYLQQKSYLLSDRLLSQLIIKPKLTEPQTQRIEQLVVQQHKVAPNSFVSQIWLEQRINKRLTEDAHDKRGLELQASYAELTGNASLLWQSYQQLSKHYPQQQKYLRQLIQLYAQPQAAKLGITSEAFFQSILLPYLSHFPFDPNMYEMAADFAVKQENFDLERSYLTKAYQTAVLSEKLSHYSIDSKQAQSTVEIIDQLNNKNLSTKQREELLAQIDKVAQKFDENESIDIDESFDHWSVNALKNRIYERSVQENTIFEIGFNSYQKSGTAGQSDYQLLLLPMALTMPLNTNFTGPARWFVRFEPTFIDAGEITFDTDSYEDFGSLKLCAPNCQPIHLQQRKKGYAIGVGIDTKTWRADIGTTPIGFDRTDWVGGFEFDGDLEPFTWSLSLAKRPVTSSVLSFSGTKDPYSGLLWGAARKYTAGGSLSYNQGEGWGMWSVLDYSLIFGEQIKKNNRLRLMAGVYYDWLDTEPMSSSVGLNAMYWQHQLDLSEYTLGQSGYYSPQSYASLSIPIDLFGRLGDLSYKLDFGLSYSQSKDDKTPYYPLHDRFQNQLTSRTTATFAGGSGGGLGYSLAATVEYKLAYHWSIGAAIDISKSEYFSPNKLSLYIRYYFDGNDLPVLKPPKLITPYMDF